MRRKRNLGDAAIPVAASTAPISVVSTPAAPAVSSPPSPTASQPNSPWRRPITPKQLAGFLQVSPRTVARLARDRSFPRLNVSGQTRFIPDDVIDYLKKKK